MAEHCAVNAGVIGSSPISRAIVLWCNGSTKVFGAFCRGSNPCGTAKLILFRKEFFLNAAVAQLGEQGTFNGSLIRKLISENSANLVNAKSKDMLTPS